MWQITRGLYSRNQALSPAPGGGGGGAAIFTLNFAAMTSSADLSTAGVTFTRSSSGTRVNSSGVLETVSTDVPRFNYDPVTLSARGLLIEPSATNLLPSAYANVSGGNGQSGTSASGTAPDGTNTLVKLTASSGSFQHYSYFSPMSQTNGSVYCTSFWVKSGGGTNGRYIALRGSVLSSPNYPWVVFDTTNKTITSNSAVIASGYEDFGTIFRVWFTWTAAGNESPLISIHDSSTPPAVTDGIPAAFTSATSDIIYYWGMQNELGAKPTALIITTGSPASRSTDSAAFTVPGGVSTLTYTFDDDSTQTVSASPGAYTIPTSLNRANIKTLQGFA